MAATVRVRADRDVVGDARPRRARITRSPMTALPAIPDLPQIRQLSPMVTLWAIWTWLSILVPRPMRVSRSVPRSIVVAGADLDVVADDDGAERMGAHRQVDRIARAVRDCGPG